MDWTQVALILLLFLLFAMFISGRPRHDVAAFGILIVAVILGIVPTDQAFMGLAHPATVTVAAMLVITKALSDSGATDWLSDIASRYTKTRTQHVASHAGLTAVLSTAMNNVGALALTMPIAMQTAARAKRSPSVLLMPMSFAALLGGIVTMIGTPPNILAASFRAEAIGEPFRMFDYTWVGLPLAIVGVSFVGFIGWRFLPKSHRRASQTVEYFQIGDYVTEVRVNKGNPLIGKTVGETGDLFDELDAAILTLVRDGRRIANVPRRFLIRPDDLLIIEVAPTNLEILVERFSLQLVGAEEEALRLLSSDDVRMSEVVVKPGSELDGRSAARDRLAHQFNVNLLAVARESSPLRDRLDRVVLRAGDVLLLQGETERLTEVTRLLGCLPLATRRISLAKRDKAMPTFVIFGIAIALASTGLLPLQIALGGAIVAMVLANVLPPGELYDAIDWPVIVLLASMIPIGGALQSTGLTAIISGYLVDASAAYGAVVALVMVFIITMAITDILNNAATVVIMAPIATGVAQGLGVNVDTFIMAVAIGASCAFLTPIGHHNNTLVMGPGGYAFGDYWRMGLPLQIVLASIGLPLLLFFWPLSG